MTQPDSDFLPDLVTLRPINAEDLLIFFEQEQDEDARWMAAFTVEDPFDFADFMEHWTRIMNDAALIKRTILFQDRVAGYIVSFEQFGKPSIGYWLGKPFWNKGIATRAVSQFVGQINTRPLYARAAHDNVGSIRVLEKCGFIKTGIDHGFATARGANIEEVIMELPK